MAPWAASVDGPHVPRRGSGRRSGYDWGMTDTAAQPTPEQDDRLTLMTVHAHPDDETIGTGGAMARAVRDGRRVVLITGTRGEQGEIVVPEMDTPDNHRRLGEIRMRELEDAMNVLGVTEWDNLGYRDSDMMGRPGNNDPRTFWQADLDEAVGRLVWFVRRLSAARHHGLQRVRRLRPSRPHPGPPGVACRRSPGPAIQPGTRSSWRPSTAARGSPSRRAGSRRGSRRSSTSRRSRPRSARR